MNGTGRRRALRSGLWVLLLLVGSARLVRADADQAFARGNEAYLHGDYRSAIEAYEQVASFGIQGPDLFYNLGDAYFRAGNLGRAVYNYERALELRPGDEDVSYNLAAARAAAERTATDRIEGAEKDPLFERAVAPFPLAMLSWSFLALYLGFFAVLIWLRSLPLGLFRSGVKAGCAFLALGTLGAGALLGGKVYLTEHVPRAVVLDKAVDVKEGADETYHTAFAVHAGLKVRVVGHDQEWVKIRLANGLEGWVQESTVGEL